MRKKEKRIIKGSPANTPEILLINPPFGSVRNPYISIPVLTAYLQDRHIAVSVYDMKREFYIQLLTPQNILRGIRYAKERFLELNNAPKLNFPQAFEYSVLFSLLLDLQKFKRETEILLFPFVDFSDIQNSKAIDFFIRAATCPYFPEAIFSEDPFAFGSAFSPFSSSAILQACNSRNYYTQLYERIIDDKILSNYSPSIIGFSVVFESQIIPAFQCAHIIKKRLPGVHITMGGPCISVCFRQVKEKRLFDIVDSFVIDEGEIPLEILVQELTARNPDLSNVPGLVYPVNNHICFNPPPAAVNIENSPPPDYTVFQLESYLSSKAKLMIPIRLSKGCRWHKCTFCRTNLSLCRDYQPLSMEEAYKQLIHIVKTTEVSSFIFSDDTTDPRVIEYISKRILEEGVKIQWKAHTRVSKHLTKERCKLYRKAGCRGLGLGIESFSDRILKLMNKGITVGLIEEVLHEIDGAIPLSVYMMVGFPTEMEEEALQGYKYLCSFVSKGLIHSYLYTLFGIAAGSDIWDHPEKYGISDVFIPEGVDLLGDIFNFKSSGMSRKRAHQLAKEFNQAINTSPQQTTYAELRIDNNLIPVCYNLQKIEERITSNNFSDLPLIQWLNTTKSELYPIV